MYLRAFSRAKVVGVDLSRMSVVRQFPECLFLLRIDNFIAFRVNKRRGAREAQKSAVVVRRTRLLEFSAGHGVDELDMQKVFLALKRDGIASLAIQILVRKHIGYRLARVRIDVHVALLEDDVVRIRQDISQYPTVASHQKFFEFTVAVAFFGSDIGGKDQVIPEFETGPVPVMCELHLRDICPTTVDVARPASGQGQILPAHGHPRHPERYRLRRCEEVFVMLPEEYVTRPRSPCAYRPGQLNVGHKIVYLDVYPIGMKISPKVIGTHAHIAYVLGSGEFIRWYGCRLLDCRAVRQPETYGHARSERQIMADKGLGHHKYCQSRSVDLRVDVPPFKGARTAIVMRAVFPRRHAAPLNAQSLEVFWGLANTGGQRDCLRCHYHHLSMRMSGRRGLAHFAQLVAGIRIIHLM